MKNFKQLALNVIHIEQQAIAELTQFIDDDFAQACELMFNCRGRVIVIGMGKSGHIGGKIAATLASTGTPSFFVHPGEASHGDLGMVTIDGNTTVHELGWTGTPLSLSLVAIGWLLLLLLLHGHHHPTRTRRTLTLTWRTTGAGLVLHVICIVITHRHGHITHITTHIPHVGHIRHVGHKLGCRSGHGVRGHHILVH